MAALILRPPRRQPPAAPGAAPPPRDAGQDFRRAAAAARAHWPLPASLRRGLSGPRLRPSCISGLGPSRRERPGPAWGGGPRTNQSQGLRGGAGRGRGRAVIPGSQTGKLRLRGDRAPTKVTPEVAAALCSNPELGFRSWLCVNSEVQLC